MSDATPMTLDELREKIAARGGINAQMPGQRMPEDRIALACLDAALAPAAPRVDDGGGDDDKGEVAT